MKHFLCAWITGLRVIKNLTMLWIMPSLALLLHIVLSMTVCSYMIRFNMYLEITLTGQCQINIYLFGLTFCQAFQKTKVIIVFVNMSNQTSIGFMKSLETNLQKSFLFHYS